MQIKTRHIVLISCSLSMGMCHAARQILPPALPLVIDEFGLNYTQAGFLASSYEIGYGLTLILGGFLGDRIRKVPLIIVALLMLFSSLALTTQGTSYVQVAAFRIITGVAYGLYFGAGVSLLSAYYPRERRGLAMGIHSGIGSGGGRFLAPLLAGLLLGTLSWRPLFFLVALPILVPVFLFWRFVREPEPERGHASLPLATTLKALLGSRLLLSLGLCNALTIGCAATVYSFLPLYMVKQMGADLAAGGFAVALLNAVGIPLIPIAGLLSDRLGRKQIIVALAFGGAVTFYIFPLLGGGVLMVVGIILMGLTTSTAFPIVLTFVADDAPPAIRSLAVGYVNTFSVIGGGIATVAAGQISDAFSVSDVFTFLALLSLGAAIFALFLPRQKRVPAVVRTMS